MARADPSPSFPRSYREAVRTLKALEGTLRYFARVRSELEAELGYVPEEFDRKQSEVAMVLIEKHEEIRRILRDWN